MATVMFVCAHGALKSRVAAALFKACAPADWQAVSAGIEPQEAVSVHAAPLVAGTAAAGLLDVTAPTAIADAPAAQQIIAIDCEIDGAATWTLNHREPGEPMRDEISDLVTALTAELRTAVPR